MTNPTFSLTKTKRLLAPSEFKAVFDNPIKKIHSTHCLLFVADTGQLHARLGLAITKKKLKKAVDRNLVKRHAREVFRLNQHDFPPVDCVLIVKSGAFVGNKKQKVDKEVSLAIVKQEFAEIFAKLPKLMNTQAKYSTHFVKTDSLANISNDFKSDA
ncbi:ribonuclease P protein component [Moraxella oblonga]|uniref:ribonuclease P protein component n=1 Tax=Moraxella oblonga TaxID=200413 RepID=UPI00082CDAA0|nr:ribonuclease P protein component [Moraxella oblonga]